jgi:hypothetical protein
MERKFSIKLIWYFSGCIFLTYFLSVPDLVKRFHDHLLTCFINKIELIMIIIIGCHNNLDIRHTKKIFYPRQLQLIVDTVASSYCRSNKE